MIASIALILFAGGASIMWVTGKEWAKWCAVVGGAIIALLEIIELIE